MTSESDPTLDTYTVVVADDHQIIRSALIHMLDNASVAERDFTVVAEATNGLEAIAAVKQHRPDVLFLDIAMPLANGVEITHDIQRWSPHTKIIVFTGVTASGLLAHIVAAGVAGVFSKGESTDLLVSQLPILMAGGHFIEPSLVDAIERGNLEGTLTERERQTLTMVVSGKSNKEIARVLSISPKTVEKHRGSLMQKLDVHSVAELMARAIQDGLIDPSANT